MAMLPRVAVGTVQPHVDLQPACWALMEALRKQGFQVQSFLSRACFDRFHGEAAATGLTPRHLDSWLMSPEIAREVFTRGAIGCDLSVVTGDYDSARIDRADCGGSLDRLCEWLDLPRVAVLDATHCDRGLPPRPAECDAVIIDYATDAENLHGLSVAVRQQWGVPTLGGLTALPQLRAAIRAVPSGARPPLSLIEALGEAFLEQGSTDDVFRLAMRRPLAWVPQRSTAQEDVLPSITVALAYDNAFDCYFPDTLDALEGMGASLVDFSPLRDDRLPDGVDIIYFGGGRPADFAAELSYNHCMKLALRSYMSGGGRVYAEGGGLAYLCEALEMPDGQMVRMAGLFSAVARRRRPSPPPAPVEIELEQPTWFAPAMTQLRGYGSPTWYFEPSARLESCVCPAQQRVAMVRHYRAIGSSAHLDFAAAPHLLRSFFRTTLAAPCVSDPWAVA